ncbi:MAG: RdgB/HAM1 family non-canonical purine NTP pyrophosphatase [Chitinophagaceae bacterium]|nr:RdgB/HAM1 family non-canonical purine NTP pyrophosphatase [Chitinophagaceae bacterium]
MTRLLFATNNQHKIEEIRAAIGNLVEVVGLKEAGIDIDVREPHNTLKANASEKSSAIFALTGTSCFSEDSGLEVQALNEEPGVRSARYAGEGRSQEDNIDKLLDHLKGKADRSARFRTVISLIWAGQEYFFEGICEGMISGERKGASGFGYDAVFIPSGSVRSFGEMSIKEKNTFSHRKKAADKLVLFLQQQRQITAHD